MRNNYDFSKGKRGAVIPSTGKTRITIYLDDNVLDSFRQKAEAEGLGYQTLINETLKAHLKESEKQPLTENDLRRVLREELIQISRSGQTVGNA
ncbi:MAG: BrnA antitoxin family protein [Leptolyngbyaceae cyanobacterium SU_3_3]|nr:BrnA antitoxin family protein [Leptolyngbyaceae cyanobacterium SU_3_3]